METHKHIKALGFELEGAWLADRRAAYAYAVNRNGIGYDGSVHVELEGGRAGEIASPVFTDVTRACEFLRTWYPDKVNATCGFHIHLSFTSDLRYQQCMSEQFYEDTYDFWCQWGQNENITNKEFFKRLDGKNQYCNAEYRAEDQVYEENKDSVRYAGLNYCHAHMGTLELRVLPMFRKQGTVEKALRAWLDFVQAWLVAHPERDVREVVECEIDTTAIHHTAEPEDIREFEVVEPFASEVSSPTFNAIVVPEFCFDGTPHVYQAAERDALALPGCQCQSCIKGRARLRRNVQSDYIWLDYALSHRSIIAYRDLLAHNSTEEALRGELCV